MWQTRQYEERFVAQAQYLLSWVNGPAQIKCKVGVVAAVTAGPAAHCRPRDNLLVGVEQAHVAVVGVARAGARLVETSIIPT